MKSRWYEYKEVILDLRRKGTSMTTIEREFGVPRSTLSGWFKEVILTEDQRTKLMQNSYDGWKKAREKAIITKNLQKAKRISQAKIDALAVNKELPTGSLAVLELSLAMLYFGEGKKKNATGMGGSDPFMILFFITSLEKIYGLDRNNFRYDLHLRDDQNEDESRLYWSSQLGIQPEKIKHIVKDKRTIGRPTYETYKGVCLVELGNIAVQRRLIALYNIYCSEVIKGD